MHNVILLRLYKQSLLAAHGQGQRFQNANQKVVGELGKPSCLRNTVRAERSWRNGGGADTHRRILTVKINYLMENVNILIFQ